jgi:uncharacterized protein (TIGR03067 family)
MLRKSALVLVAALLAGADAPKDTAKGEVKKVQGTWKATSLTYNGKEVPVDGKRKIRLVFKGDTASVEADKSTKKEYAKVKFAFDPSTKPRCVDLTVVGGVQKDTTMEGIYELKGNKLKLCVKVLGKERPTKFESPEGESIALIEFERVKK